MRQMNISHKKNYLASLKTPTNTNKTKQQQQKTQTHKKQVTANKHTHTQNKKTLQYFTIENPSWREQDVTLIVFSHGDGLWIHHSWWTIELFLFSASAPQLV